ncbi:hypothetical protein L6164_025399 [Bauhinia variegata]|uniref:Uncharacterized protein n=1 Tax=Bauhinia variegata TaxID=167791 RepID=A0ACB9M326_BAUVA|nr:hypothetical protein L6164_025399 [Bauhinia variegata]
MEKEHDYSAPMPPSFNTLDYSQYPQNQQLMKFRLGETSGESSNGMVDYMLHNPHQQQPMPSGFYGTGGSYFDKLSFADVMHFADFGPKLGLNQTKAAEDEPGLDPVYFLKFPVLNDKNMEDQNNLMVSSSQAGEAENDERFKGMSVEDKSPAGGVKDHDEEAWVSDNNNNNSVELRFLGEEVQKNPTQENKNKRKRPRTIKTSQEVESQRMTHIAVERNRRKQMNEHLRVLRSLMPGSYVQRGDQASIIGGAIEFVRELEQLLQCLESQKRRRLLGEAGHSRPQVGDSSLQMQQAPFFPPMPLPNDPQMLETGLLEETAENKSCLADVEVKLLGFDAMIKILSRRRPGQLIKTIAALEDLQLIILHTNITTIEQTVLYSFNVKVASDSRFTAEDIASSVQQIFSFIHANTGI